MSKISKLFKGSSSSSSSSKNHRSRGGPSPQEAIHRLRETEEMLTKKQEYLEKRIEQELMLAKKHGTKNKRGMFLCWFSKMCTCFPEPRIVNPQAALIILCTNDVLVC